MSYTGPSNSTRDETRFLTGDTDTTDELLTDDEYDYLLAEYTNPMWAAAVACDAIATKLARKVDTTVGRASKSLSQAAQAYADRANHLRRRASVQSATIKAGGISRTDKDTVEDDTDRVEPRFQRDMHTTYTLASDNEAE